MSTAMTNGRAVISIEPFGSIDVDLWGHKFTTVPATRSVNKQSEELGEQIAAETDSDKAIRLLAETIGLRLKPKGQAKKSAADVIVEKWEADKVSLPQLEALLDRLLEADRPT